MEQDYHSERQGMAGHFGIPASVIGWIISFLRGTAAEAVCDPWLQDPSVLQQVAQVTGALKAIGLAETEHAAARARRLLPDADIQVGQPLQLLAGIDTPLDVVASNLPFWGPRVSAFVRATTGKDVEVRAELGQLVLLRAAQQLSDNGIGVFVVPPSFFLTASVFHKLDGFGIGVEAALEMPPGVFAPFTHIKSYVVVVRKRPVGSMFVARLSGTADVDAQIVANFKNGQEGGLLELGRYVDAKSFKSLERIRFDDQLRATEREFGYPAVPLRDLASEVRLGRFDEELTDQDNAIFVPLIGISDVVEQVEDLTLKSQNYARITIKPDRSDARFVAKYLNSELGRATREAAKTGTTIPKLNKATLLDMPVFVPDMSLQKKILAVEGRIATERNTLSGLQNEIGELRRHLWSHPTNVAQVEQRLTVLSKRLSGGLAQHTEASLEQWFDTLPFPLASILRMWQATGRHDPKARYETLLHFFEAASEFTSAIMLSAFASQEALLAQHEPHLTALLKKQNHSFKRAAFGTWRLILEYLGKRTREFLNGDMSGRELCAGIYCDPACALPEVLSQVELTKIFATTNAMRNQWKGHAGAVTSEQAAERNALLLVELQNFRTVTRDAWERSRLVLPLSCRNRRGVFANEVSVLMSSNPHFISDTLPLAECLDAEEIYLVSEGAVNALRLAPLVRISASPQSARNACYFLSNLKNEGTARFVSYHFSDTPDMMGQLDKGTPVAKFLASV